MGNPFRIAMVAAEAVPYAKTGGLADMVGALSRELVELGHDVRLIIPRYREVRRSAIELNTYAQFPVPSVKGSLAATVERVNSVASQGAEVGRLSTFAIGYDTYFDRDGLYQESGLDYPDNLERFSFFCRAALELLLVFHAREGWTPQVLHAHDWQTALCVVYHKTIYAGQTAFSKLKTVLTLHNIGYQGIFPATDFPCTGLPTSLFTPSGLEFYRSVNLLKGGIQFADLLTTVSPTYSREILASEYGFGLEGVLDQRRADLHGILNGIDTSTWNPMLDPLLPKHFSRSDLAGKRECKRELQRESDLPTRDVPLLGNVSRLTSQKGLDFIADIVPELMELDLQLVILGAGEEELERRFRSLVSDHPKKMSFRQGFDEGLAHRVFAGADIFLMPSRYEPCGLSQLYSLRYGTVPIVRKTGGLADTVVPYSPLGVKQGRSTGFAFNEPVAESLLTTLLLCLYVHREDRVVWEQLLRTGMQLDLSWRKSAQMYLSVYGSLQKEPRAVRT